MKSDPRMPAGPALDLAVHELLTGEGPCACLDCRYEVSFGREPRHPVPAYSSDIAAAWAVVEWLLARGVPLVGFAFDESVGLWDCRERAGDDYRERLASQGVSPGHAVCAAALLFAAGEGEAGRADSSSR